MVWSEYFPATSKFYLLYHSLFCFLPFTNTKDTCFLLSWTSIIDDHLESWIISFSLRVQLSFSLSPIANRSTHELMNMLICSFLFPLSYPFWFIYFGFADIMICLICLPHHAGQQIIVWIWQLSKKKLSWRNGCLNLKLQFWMLKSAWKIANMWGVWWVTVVTES